MKSDLLQNWKAPMDAIVPNFIIGGAMKSGTSTLHAMLVQHPEVFIPEEEIGFFDIDNIIEHYDFNFYDKKAKRWTSQDMVKNPDLLWNWYSSKFTAGKGKMLGEDSTSYLTSKFAAERISLQEKPIKLIFMLRHPSQRAYSNYFHLLRSGIVVHSFEDVLQFHPDLVLRRSLYKDQLESYYKHIPKENIKVVVFEDLIENPKAVMKDVCSFLNLDMDVFDPTVFETHSNRGELPWLARIHRLKNLFFRSYGNSFYQKALPNKAPKNVVKRMFFSKVANRIHGILNPLKDRITPKMNPGTQDFLDDYFKKELAGLDELAGAEVLSKWFL
ncbi:MAG: sulfotransferase [Bacteroidetes bacterium]|nr:sulfotransferase [Bacteroidota bacterium]